ncbi:MAG: cache domain-containing protein, partial [Phormidium sp.]
MHRWFVHQRSDRPIFILDINPMTIMQRLPLRTALVGLFVGQILVAVGLVGYLSFRNGQSATNHLAAKLQMETTRRVQDRLNHFLATPQQVAAMSYQAAQWEQLDLNDPVALEQEFWQKAKLFPAISGIYVATPTGQFSHARRVGAEDIEVLSVGSPDSTLRRYQTDPNGNRTTLVAESADYDPRIRPWYLRGVEAQQPLWGPVFSWSDPEPTLGMTAIHPLRDETDQLVAIFAVDLSLFSINDFLRTLQVGESGEVFLMERNGTLMATSVGESVDPQTLSSLPAEESDNALIREAGMFLARQDVALEAIAEDQQFSFTADHERHLMQVTPYQDDYGLDWLIVVVLPESDFMAQINANTRTSIMLCLLALGVATLLGIGISRWIAQPILRFNEAAEAIAQGNLSQRISCDRLAELCTMAETFNRMSSQLNHSFDAL